MQGLPPDLFSLSLLGKPVTGGGVGGGWGNWGGGTWRLQESLENVAMVTASSVRGAVARDTVKGGKKKKKIVCVLGGGMTCHSRLLALLSYFLCVRGFPFSPSRLALSPKPSHFRYIPSWRDKVSAHVCVLRVEGKAQISIGSK